MRVVNMINALQVRPYPDFVLRATVGSGGRLNCQSSAGRKLKTKTFLWQLFLLFYLISRALSSEDNREFCFWNQWVKWCFMHDNTTDELRVSFRMPNPWEFNITRCSLWRFLNEMPINHFFKAIWMFSIDGLFHLERGLIRAYILTRA